MISIYWYYFELLFYYLLISVHSFSAPRRIKKIVKVQKSKSNHPNNTNDIYSFSVPLINAKPKPESFIDKTIELWNDPRDIRSIVSSDDRSFVGNKVNGKKGPKEEIPYCIISDEFEIDNESFQILLYPQGRFAKDYSSINGLVNGPASAYLRYLPKQYGDEIDIAWKLKLSAKDPSNESEDKNLSVSTSGGLPRSKDTWSAAMTFCSDLEAVESVGRAKDWGCSTWNAKDVCDGLLGNLFAEGEITVFSTRKGESSFSWPPLSKGGIGAVRRAITTHSAIDKQREFKVGEVIVSRNMRNFAAETKVLKEQFIYPGVDYRIMTMTDKDGNPVFSTESLNNDKERNQVRLALRPCGWKLQQQLWKKNGMKIDWPVEVNAGLLSNIMLTRFDPRTAIPRIVAAFQRDWVAYTFALLIALAPIPLTLVARNFVSLYVIPSASMEPTLLKGDVLLVEKLPGVYQRTKRGDVVLFRPPPTLKEIVIKNGSQLSSTSLFVKRIVGLPGDQNIELVENNNVIINGEKAIGPDRKKCMDEPLRLIDKLLENGKGKKIDQLGANDVYVLGDCNAVSVDSRVFGTLPKENIVGKPIARILPLDRLKYSGPF